MSPRNPMYLSLVLVLVLTEYALFRRSLLAFVPVIGVVAVLDRQQIPAEEAVLERKFGTEYRDYAARVPRWVRARHRGQCQ